VESWRSNYANRYANAQRNEAERCGAMREWRSVIADSMGALMIHDEG